MGSAAIPVFSLACYVLHVRRPQRTDGRVDFSFFHQRSGDLPQIALHLTVAPDLYAYNYCNCFPHRKIFSLGDARRRGTKVQEDLAAPLRHFQKTYVVETLSVI